MSAAAAGYSLWIVLGVLILGAILQLQQYLPDLPSDHPAIRYADRQVDDPVARLSRERGNDVSAHESGQQEAHREPGLGVLGTLLRRLDVAVDSQALAFAKTSFQANRVAPDNPRAIYFNDDVAVAYVRGSDLIEIASVDPEIGPIFYTVDLGSLPETGFERRQVCLECHLGPATSGVPGLFVGSVVPDPTGKPARAEAIITDHRTAFEDRWGGWYVNATRGQQRDRSNAVASSPAQPLLLDEGGGRNLLHLYGKFDPARYLAPMSDIVALMTFEHQTQMLNYLTRVSWQERIALHDDEWTEAERRGFDADIEALVAYMVFEDEVPLPEPVEGVSSFTESFPRRGPHDSEGRSLRDFDLEHRLFRYPLSYMIYSRSFDALSDATREAIYRRLDRKLVGEQRVAILEILRETKPGLPDYFGTDLDPMK